MSYSIGKKFGIIKLISKVFFFVTNDPKISKSVCTCMAEWTALPTLQCSILTNIRLAREKTCQRNTVQWAVL